MNNNFFCPRKGCPNHQYPNNDLWYRFYKNYETKVLGTQPRYICKRCGKTFSPRTFSIDYYAKRRIDYKKLLNQQISASGINDMAREMNCTTETVQNRIRRLSHQFIGAMALHMRDFSINEDLSADGLESFIESQFFPTNINILVGRRSQFIYFFDAYFFKRKGRMTEKQKKKRKDLYDKTVFEAGGASKAFLQLLDHLNKIWDRDIKKTLILDTDENPIYSSALKQNSQLMEAMASGLFHHRLTNSRKERNYHNKLFPSNYCDRMVRKDLAEHVRETVQFPKNQSCSMERFSLYQFWLNFIKPYRIKPRNSVLFKTHSEAAGLSGEIREAILDRVWKGNRITYEEVQDYLTPFNKKIWFREVMTPCCGSVRGESKYISI